MFDIIFCKNLLFYDVILCVIMNFMKIYILLSVNEQCEVHENTPILLSMRNVFILFSVFKFQQKEIMIYYFAMYLIYMS